MIEGATAKEAWLKIFHPHTPDKNSKNSKVYKISGYTFQDPMTAPGAAFTASVQAVVRDVDVTIQNTQIEKISVTLSPGTTPEEVLQMIRQQERRNAS